MGRTIAVVNQKGGVGKTTTIVNLATAFAAIGKRVLLIDFDPQGNASTGFGFLNKKHLKGTYDVLIGREHLSSVVRHTVVPNLHLLAATNDLAAVDVELIHEKEREFRLKNILKNEKERYDFIFIDCPPSLNLLTVNALAAADSVMIPLQCEYYALEGLSQLVNTMSKVRRGLNPDLKIEGIVLTMFDKRSSLSEMVASDVKAHFAEIVFETVIPRNVKLSEAPSHGKPCLIYDFKSLGSQAYIKLASEMLKKEAA